MRSVLCTRSKWAGVRIEYRDSERVAFVLFDDLKHIIFTFFIFYYLCNYCCMCYDELLILIKLNHLLILEYFDFFILSMY